MNPEARKILEDTYDILEARGWCQGTMQQPDGKVCLEGAFRAACGYKDTEEDYALYASTPSGDAWETLCRTVEQECRFAAPWAWNDDPARTVEDVKLLLKRAIES
ncbi:DUF6197 family protein [Streptomyces roseolus]|uniref:DUF6197 family protein n=1 Tax=Streptomyces roseolus TaxID=67358 RepID=UPI0016765D6B|nr:hypothetical protein [Streptomyces roseolus]GGR51725.1 hypothetical protein GCM10010282_50830 [Streptomyces roseolus]